MSIAKNFPDFDRRRFLASAGKGLGLMALSSATVASLFENVNAAGKAVAHLTPAEAAANEDFWAAIQQAFSVTRGIVNLIVLNHPNDITTHYAHLNGFAKGLAKGQSVSHAHLRWLSPLEPGLAKIIRNFKQVIVAELNMGQLRTVLRAEFLIDCIGVNKIQGQPFKVKELIDAIEKHLAQPNGTATANHTTHADTIVVA